MILAYILFGLLTGLLSGLVGVGGGLILIPLLLLVDTPIETAVSASLVFVFFSAASGALRHGFQKNTDWRLGGIVAVSSILPTIYGAYLTTRVPTSVLQVILALCPMVGIYLMSRSSGTEFNSSNITATKKQLCPPNVRIGKQREESYPLHTSRAVLVGCGVGFLTGLLGIGGGFLKVPLFVEFLKIPIRIAIGTSLLTILFSAAAGIILHWGLGNTDPTIVWATTLAGVLSAQLGATLVKKLREQLLKAILNCILLLTAIYLLLRGIGIF